LNCVQSAFCRCLLKRNQCKASSKGAEIPPRFHPAPHFSALQPSHTFQASSNLSGTITTTTTLCYLSSQPVIKSPCYQAPLRPIKRPSQQKVHPLSDYLAREASFLPPPYSTTKNSRHVPMPQKSLFFLRGHSNGGETMSRRAFVGAYTVCDRSTGNNYPSYPFRCRRGCPAYVFPPNIILKEVSKSSNRYHSS
jgi:hypothetical protein